MRFKVVHGRCVDEEMEVSASRDGGGGSGLVCCCPRYVFWDDGKLAGKSSLVEHPGPERIIP